MADPETQDRPELPDETADAVLARRAELHAATQRLDRELTAIARQPDGASERLRAALRDMLATVQAHVEGADASDGPLAQITETAPWLGSRVSNLRDEHATMLDRATRLADRAGAGEATEPLASQARELSSLVAGHRHRATTLLLDAYMLDIPAGD